jgi:ElaB/YqjD/DUF883 family membrane-anchored ribosome-binding protein
MNLFQSGALGSLISTHSRRNTMLTTRMNEAKSAVQDNLNSPEVENIKEDFRALKSDVATLARHVKEDGAAIAGKTAQDLKEEASEKYTFLKEQTRKQADKLEAQVHAKPIQSIAIAFGAGLALALLARR